MAIGKETTIVWLATTGLTASFEGDGFPKVTRYGTRMTKEEAEKAHSAAAANGLTLNEVTRQ